MTVQVKITSPISETCNATPVHLVLQSTSAYNTTTKDVDLSDTTYSIPNFTSTCWLARSSLDTRFSGSSGNVLTLDLHGTLPEPPPPATSTTTTLSASPASPQLQGTTVTLTGTVKKHRRPGHDGHRDHRLLQRDNRGRGGHRLQRGGLVLDQEPAGGHRLAESRLLGQQRLQRQHLELAELHHRAPPDGHQHPAGHR